MKRLWQSVIEGVGHSIGRQVFDETKEHLEQALDRAEAEKAKEAAEQQKAQAERSKRVAEAAKAKVREEKENARSIEAELAALKKKIGKLNGGPR